MEAKERQEILRDNKEENIYSKAFEDQTKTAQSS